MSQATPYNIDPQGGQRVFTALAEGTKKLGEFHEKYAKLQSKTRTPFKIGPAEPEKPAVPEGPAPVPPHVKSKATRYLNSLSTGHSVLSAEQLRLQGELKAHLGGKRGAEKYIKGHPLYNPSIGTGFNAVFGDDSNKKGNKPDASVDYGD